MERAKSLGIRCSCGEETAVIDSRGVIGAIRRRRKCKRKECRQRFSTHEHRDIAKQKHCFVVVHTIEEDGRVRTKTFEVTPESGRMVIMQGGKVVTTAIETPLRMAS